jgi:hypothetical protein
MFDAFLRMRAAPTGEPFVPFDAVNDYDEYVDGKPRYDGVRSFLAARGIQLPEGMPSDPPPVVERPAPSQPPGRAPRRRGTDADQAAR